MVGFDFSAERSNKIESFAMSYSMLKIVNLNLKIVINVVLSKLAYIQREFHNEVPGANFVYLWNGLNKKSMLQFFFTL